MVNNNNRAMRKMNKKLVVACLTLALANNASALSLTALEFNQNGKCEKGYRQISKIFYDVLKKVKPSKGKHTVYESCHAFTDKCIYCQLKNAHQHTGNN